MPTSVPFRMIIAGSVSMLISAKLLFLLAGFSFINVSSGLSPCDTVDYTTSPSPSSTQFSEQFQITIGRHVCTQAHVKKLFSFPSFIKGDRGNYSFIQRAEERTLGQPVQSARLWNFFKC